LDEKNLPTIGANGFLVRREELLKGSVDNYLFDIDVVYELIIRKTKRRIKDYILTILLISNYT